MTRPRSPPRDGRSAGALHGARRRDPSRAASVLRAHDGQCLRRRGHRAGHPRQGVLRAQRDGRTAASSRVAVSHRAQHRHGFSASLRTQERRARRRRPRGRRVRGAGGPIPALVEAALTAFVSLPPVQRSAVVLKDVLGHSLEETASTMGTTVLAVKSALVRARANIAADAPPRPSISAEEKKSLQRYAKLFNARNWDGLRALLGEEARLDLVSRWQRRGSATAGYYSRYAEITPVEDLRAEAGFADGVPVIAVYRPGSTRPAYFIRLKWEQGRRHGNSGLLLGALPRGGGALHERVTCGADVSGPRPVSRGATAASIWRTPTRCPRQRDTRRPRWPGRSASPGAGRRSRAPSRSR